MATTAEARRSRGAQHGGVPTTPVLQRSPLPNDPFYRLRNDPRQNTIPVLDGSLLVDGPGFPTIPGGSTTAECQQHRFFNDPRFPTILFTGCATIPVKIPSQSSMDPCWSMDLDFATIPGGPPRRSPNNTGSLTIPASQRSLLPVAQRSPSKYHPSPQCDPFCRWTGISNDPGGATTAEARRSRGAQHGGVPTTPVLQRSPLPNDPFYRLRNDPRQNTIPVLKRWPLWSMDLDFQRSRGAHHGGVPTTPVLQRSPLPNDPFLPVAQRSPSKYHPSRWNGPFCRWTWISNDPGEPTTAEDRRSRGAQHRGVPTTPVFERSPLPNDPFYRLRNDPRQNTIPVHQCDPFCRWTWISNHPGGPTTAEARRSPGGFSTVPEFPTIPFTGCFNGPRQNTIPVIKRSLLLVDLDCATIPGCPPRRSTINTGPSMIP